MKGLDVWTIFDASKKTKSMILLASMKLLTNYENAFSNPPRDLTAAILTMEMHTESRL